MKNDIPNDRLKELIQKERMEEINKILEKSYLRSLSEDCKGISAEEFFEKLQKKIDNDVQKNS